MLFDQKAIYGGEEHLPEFDTAAARAELGQQRTAQASYDESGG
jgi:hypothetical protein